MADKAGADDEDMADDEVEEIWELNEADHDAGCQYIESTCDK